MVASRERVVVDGPGLSVGAVARRLGVAPSTLRTWDRRYGIGPSRRSAGSHRRYDADDVARLEMMNRLILEGVPPEEAARVAVAGGVSGSASAPRHERAEGEPATVPEPEPEPGSGPEPEPGSGKGLGGRRLAVPGATTATRALARAAMALDDRTVDELIGSALRRDGIVRTWDDLLVPVLTGVGDRFGATGAGVEVEHLLSERVMSALVPLSGRPAEPLNTRPVLLACAAEDQHVLAVHALAAALTAERVAVRVLGARTPYDALAEAIERTGPVAVFVWSQLAETGDPAPLAALPGRRPALRLVAGGPGWATERLPGRARLVRSLPAAVAELKAALGPA